jgi:aminobenzoyl-glutamate utilization protein B
MKNMFTVLFLLITVFAAQAQSKKNDGEKIKMISNLESGYQSYKTIASQIWDFAEVGYKEEQSSTLLQETLKKAGFNVESSVAGMPTAFVGSWGNSSPVIGILAEFDALPGLSQTVKPEKEPSPNHQAGHACGHHLFGTASIAAAIELREAMIRNKLNGTIKVFGTPAEEGGSGKVYMVREGLFNSVDVVLHWHPDSKNNSNTNTSLANITAKFRFKGISAHAAVAPEQGRSALDGVEAMNYMVNMMREHVSSDARIHYVITDGGKAPNVVPDYAEVYYYARHADRNVLRGIFTRIVSAAEGAAQGTGTKVEYEIIGGVYDLLPVEYMARIMHSNLNLVGGVKYSDSEIDFARANQKTMLGKTPAM